MDQRHDGRVRLFIGRRAEEMAGAHLERCGYRILARNWWRPQGELDLVAARDGVCVFVEVRSRTGQEMGHPLETVGRTKRLRVIRAARLYMDEERPAYREFRFDAVGVTFFPDGRPPEIVHVVDAFRLGC